MPDDGVLQYPACEYVLRPHGQLSGGLQVQPVPVRFGSRARRMRLVQKAKKDFLVHDVGRTKNTGRAYGVCGA